MGKIGNKISGGVTGFLRHLIQGDGVSSRFFKKHFFVTGFVLLACILMIAMRFQCITSDNTIDSLNRQIAVMSTEKQKQRSLYMTLTRESAMAHLVDSLNLGLAIPDEHPRIITVRSSDSN